MYNTSDYVEFQDDKLFFPFSTTGTGLVFAQAGVAFLHN